MRRARREVVEFLAQECAVINPICTVDHMLGV